MCIRNLQLILILIFPTVLFVTSCASARYAKKAEKFEEAGLFEDAANYYYEAVKRKDSNVEAKLGLRKTGQFTLDKKLKEIKDAYKQADFEKVVYHYLDAEAYYDKVGLVSVDLIFPDIYQSYYTEAKNDFLSELYREGVEKLNREEFNAAQRIFKEISSVDRGYKDVAEKYTIAKYEPVYRDANSFLENELYRKAYYAYDEILSGAGNYKQTLSLRNEALEKGTISILVTGFGYSQQTYKQKAAILTSGLKSQLVELNNPFIKIIDEASVQKQIYENGKINMKAADLSGIKAVLSGKVLNIKKHNWKLNKATKKGYLKEVKKSINSEGLEVTKVNYKKTEYTRYLASNSVELQVDFSLVSTDDNQVIVSELYKLSNSDKVDYAKFDGDKNKLVPGYWKSKMYKSNQDVIKDNWNDINSLKNLLRADQKLKPVSVLLDELVDQSIEKIVDKVDDYNPE